MTTERYDQLALFAIVAQERSFTRAAARLGMSQPALSRAMRPLEERLGVRLLARRVCVPGRARARLKADIGARGIDPIGGRKKWIDARDDLGSKLTGQALIDKWGQPYRTDAINA